MESTEHHLNENLDSELVGTIYEIALDHHQWPDLLVMLGDMLSHLNQVNSDENTRQGSVGENNKISCLLPHIRRALTISRRLSDTKQEYQFTHSIIDQLYIGIVIVNTERQVISSNKRASEIIDNQLGLTITNNKFFIDDKKKNDALSKYIEQLTKKEIKNNNDNTYSLAVNQQDQAALSLLVSANSYNRYHCDNNAERRVTLFIASPFNRHTVSHDALRSLFQLSPAEARLAASLASGISIDDFSLENHIARHTARTQLKSIFQKTSTHKQTELIKLVLTSPAVLTNFDEKKHSLKKDLPRKTSKHFINEEIITLTDGRQFGFCEYGEADGIPLFFFHGILGSRYERYPDDLTIKRLGIRLIIPDRPGYGYSDVNKNGSYLEFVDDVVQLADYLNIRVFSVFGLSVGATYAAACAYKIPKRITSATLLSMPLYFHSFSDMADLLPIFKILHVMAKYIPTASRIFPEIIIKKAILNPDSFFRNMPITCSDRDIVFREKLHQHLIQSLLAGCETSHTGFVEDLISSAHPLPFSFEDIKIKLDFWHGTDDLQSPIRKIIKLTEKIDTANITSVQGAGHFFIYDHWDDILESIIKKKETTPNLTVY